MRCFFLTLLPLVLLGCSVTNPSERCNESFVEALNGEVVITALGSTPNQAKSLAYKHLSEYLESSVSTERLSEQVLVNGDLKSKVSQSTYYTSRSQFSALPYSVETCGELGYAVSLHYDPTPLSVRLSVPYIDGLYWSDATISIAPYNASVSVYQRGKRYPIRNEELFQLLRNESDLHISALLSTAGEDDAQAIMAVTKPFVSIFRVSSLGNIKTLALNSEVANDQNWQVTLNVNAEGYVPKRYLMLAINTSNPIPDYFNSERHYSQQSRRAMFSELLGMIRKNRWQISTDEYNPDVL
jgi:hypothetical protein